MIEDEAGHKKLAIKIARGIMAIGDEVGSPAQRIQFMGGTYPDNETEQGGLNEKALSIAIERILCVD